jgi:Protein of unknown function (DUF2568)
MALRGANLALRFLLELCALAALGYWGWTTGSGVTRWLLAAAAVGAMAVVWGLFLAPKRRIDLAKPLRLAIEFVVFGAASAGLAATGQTALAIAFAIVAVISGTLNYVWDSPEARLTGER